MEEGRVGFFQEAFRGFLKCLGLESLGEKGAAAPVEVVEAVNNSPPPITYEPLPSLDQSSTTDPLVQALTSSVETAVVSTRDIGESALDEIMKTSTSGGEAHYVELNGNASMTLLSTRLISSGGKGKNH